MNRNLIGISIIALSMSPNPLFADAVSDASAVRSVYSGSFELDSYNPASTVFETLLPSQSIELKLTTKSLNLIPLDLLGFIDSGDRSKGSGSSPNRDDTSSTALLPVTFHSFQVWIDGCNVSDQVADLCNRDPAGACWSNSSVTHVIPSADQSLGSEFSFARPISMNQLDPSLCTTGNFTGFQEDKKYQIEFREALNEQTFTNNAAGRVDYEISVYNHTYGSRSTNHPKKGKHQ